MASTAQAPPARLLACRGGQLNVARAARLLLLNETRAPPPPPAPKPGAYKSAQLPDSLPACPPIRPAMFGGHAEDPALQRGAACRRPFDAARSTSPVCWPPFAAPPCRHSGAVSRRPLAAPHRFWDFLQAGLQPDQPSVHTRCASLTGTGAPVWPLHAALALTVAQPPNSQLQPAGDMATHHSTGIKLQHIHKIAPLLHPAACIDNLRCGKYIYWRPPYKSLLTNPDGQRVNCLLWSGEPLPPPLAANAALCAMQASEGGVHGSFSLQGSAATRQPLPPRLPAPPSPLAARCRCPSPFLLGMRLPPCSRLGVCIFRGAPLRGVRPGCDTSAAGFALAAALPAILAAAFALGWCRPGRCRCMSSQPPGLLTAGARQCPCSTPLLSHPPARPALALLPSAVVCTPISQPPPAAVAAPIASQSSQGGASLAAGRAIDGNNATYSSTAAQRNPGWALDLRRQVNVSAGEGAAAAVGDEPSYIVEAHSALIVGHSCSMPACTTACCLPAASLKSRLPSLQ